MKAKEDKIDMPFILHGPYSLYRMGIPNRRPTTTGIVRLARYGCGVDDCRHQPYPFSHRSHGWDPAL